MRAASLALALAFASLGVIRPSEAGLDRSIERSMDSQARDAIESSYEVVKDPALVAFVNRLGQKVAQQTGRKDVEFVFQILDTPEVNALALPAGHVYVTTGLLEFVDSSDELAAVLAHESAHVARRHSLSQFKKQFWADVLFGFLRIPQTASQVGQVAFGLSMLRHSRKDEAEADRLGASYAYAAGYDPRELRRFMDKLAKKSGSMSTLESYLSTHPTSERRSERLSELPELDPSRAETVETIGSGYERRHLVNLAILDFRKAAADSPGAPGPHRALAQAYVRLGATDAAQAERVRLASLSPGEKIEIPDSGASRGPAPPDVTSKVAAARQRLQEVLSAAPHGDSLKTAVDGLAASHKSLAERKKAVQRSLSRSSAGDARQRESLGRAAQVLRQVEQSLPAIEEAGDRLEADAGQVREIGQELDGALKTETDPERQAQLAAWAQEFSRRAEKGEDQTSEVMQAATKAAAAADQALRHLDEALSYMGHSGLQGPSLATTSGTAELEAAEKQAKLAAEEARKAKSLRAYSQAESIAWRLNLKTVSTSQQQKTEIDALVAEMLGLEQGEVTSARAKAGGAGSALLSLVWDSPQAGEKPEAGPEKPGERPTALLLMNIVADDIERDLEAAGEWREGARQKSASVP